MSTAITISGGTSYQSAVPSGPGQAVTTGSLGSTYEEQQSDAQLGELWCETLTLSALYDLDLTALVGERGRTVTFSLVQMIEVEIPDQPAGVRLTLGGAPANAWTGPLGGTAPTVQAAANSPFRLGNLSGGWAVDATHKILRLTPTMVSGAAVVATILVYGNAPTPSGPASTLPYVP